MSFNKSVTIVGIYNNNNIYRQFFRWNFFFQSRFWEKKIIINIIVIYTPQLQLLIFIVLII